MSRLMAGKAGKDREADKPDAAGRKKYSLKDVKVLARLTNGDTLVEATGYRKRVLLARLDSEGDKVCAL